MPVKYRQGDDPLGILASSYKSNLCTVMPVKYRQGDDLLGILASSYKSNLCTGYFERQKPFTMTYSKS